MHAYERRKLNFLDVLLAVISPNNLIEQKNRKIDEIVEG